MAHSGGAGPEVQVRGSPPSQIRNSKVGGLPCASWVSLALHSKGTQPDKVCHGGRWFGLGPKALSPSLFLALPHNLGPFSHKSSGLPQIKGSRWASAGSSFLCLSGLVKYLKCQGPWEPARFCHSSSGVCPVPVEGQAWRRAGSQVGGPAPTEGARQAGSASQRMNSARSTPPLSDSGRPLGLDTRSG